MSMSPLSDQFFRDMVKMKYPLWSNDELRAFEAWKNGNDPRVWDHIVRLWRTLRKERA